MKVREESKLLPPPSLKKIHPKMEMKTLPCSLGKWAKCFRRKDKATFDEED